MITSTSMNASLSTFQRVLLGIILLEIPLRLDAHLGYHEAEAAYGALGGWNISVTTLCLGVLYAAWLANSAVQKARNDRWWLGGILPALVYLGAVALSVVVAQQRLFAMFELFAMLQAFLVFLYLFRWVRTNSDVRFVVGLLVIGLVLESICMLGLFALGQSVQMAGIFARLDDGRRVGGTIGSPNEAASYLTLLLPLALGVILGGWGRRWKLLASAAFMLGVMALITTQSRGGWVGFALALSLFGGAAVIRRRVSIAIPLAIGVAAVLVAIVFQDVIVTRLTRHDRGAAYSRIALMQVAMEVIEDAPILGAGANNFAVAMLPYSQSSEHRGAFMFVVHNRHLQVWAETGIVGLMTWLAFLLTALARGWRVWRGNDYFLAPLALGMVAGIAGEMLHMTVEVFGGRSQMQMLWVLAALTAVLYQINRRDAPKPHAAPLSRKGRWGVTNATGPLARTAQA